MKPILTAFILIFTINASAQNAYTYVDNYAHILISDQNDYWKWRAPTDRFFTNSIYIEHINDKLYDNLEHTFLMMLFPRFKYDDTNNNFGFGLGQDMYTPSDLSEFGIIPNDRPYAGYLYFTAKNVSNSFTNQSRLSTQYQIGVLGNISFADEVQTWWHNAIGSQTPRGWDNQIANDFGFNLNLNYERRILQPVENIDFIVFGDMNILSTISNNISVGLHYRYGKFNDYFTNITARTPKENETTLLENNSCYDYCYATRKKFQVFGFVKTSVTSLLDNSFLEGGVFNRSSPHTINTDDINRFYINGEFGLQIHYLGWNLSYSQLFRTSEFRNSSTSYWGKIELIIPL